MRQIHCSILMVTVAVLVAATGSAITETADHYLSDWPDGNTPSEIGRRVAENFLDRRFDYETNPKRQYVIYPEVISEYGALKVAKLTRDADLQKKLVQKFEPFLKGELAQRVSNDAHVDYHVFGIVPLEIYMDTKEPQFLA